MFLTKPQMQIIDRAASSVRFEWRPNFRKYVEDQVRARRDPPDDSDIRHACGAAIVKYGHRI
jgi:hypothetical protein